MWRVELSIGVALNSALRLCSAGCGLPAPAVPPHYTEGGRPGRQVTREEAARRITAQNEPYKLEILAGLQEPITIYHIGDEWWDLCAGPHVESTGKLNMEAIQLESVAGAYWRGDETKDMLQVSVAG
jgi:hypothetical protein